MQLRFHTNLSKEECIERLNNAFKQKFFSAGKDIVGKVKGDKFYFRKPQQDVRFGGSFFNKKFSGYLQSVADGTEIAGTFTIWTFFNISFMGIIVFGLLIALSSNPISIWKLLLFLGGLSIFYYSIRDRGTEQINFIKDTLKATQIS